MRSVLTILLLASVFGPCSRATSVVAFWTDDWIVLGTDSAEGSFFDPTSTPPTTKCKLEHVKDTYFAMAGLVKTTGIPYDVRAKARESISEPGKTMTQHFLNLESYLTMWVPLTINPNLRKGQPGLEVFFAGSENGRPVLMIERFAADGEGGSLPPERIDLGAAKINGLGYYAAGYGAVILGSAARVLCKRLGPEVAVERAIAAMIAFAPEDVRGPISIVRIEGGKSKWIKPGLCREP